MAKIVPAILAKTEKEFKTKLALLEPFFDLIQIDCMDGKFVKNKSFYDVKRIGRVKGKSTFELHLMVEDPRTIILRSLRNKRFARYTIHYESFHKSDRDLGGIISLIKQAKREVFVALNPGTKPAALKEYARKIDGILIMGIVPGFSGKRIKKETYSKIKKTRKLFPKLKIAVDGGVNEKNYKSLIKAGADIINSASMVFKWLKN